MTNADRIRTMTDEELADIRVGELREIVPCSVWIAVDVPGRAVFSKSQAIELELEYLKKEVDSV